MAERGTDVVTNWPIIGMLPSLLLNMHRLHDWCTEVLGATGRTFVFKGPWFGCMDMLITCDPANINHILTTNFANFPKGSDYVEIFDVHGDGIFNSEADVWRLQRRMAHTQIKFKGFRQFVAKTSREMVENRLIPLLKDMAHQSKVVDLQDLLQRFSFDRTCVLVFGVNPNCLSVDFPTVPFAVAVDEAKEVIHFRHTVPVSWWKLLRWLRIGRERKLAMAWDTIDRFISSHISMRREELRKPKINGTDEADAINLLTSYMGHESEDRTGNTIKTDKFLRDTTLNFLVAGRDTISASLTWFFWLVSKNPTVESKILAELRTIRSSEEGWPTKPRVFDAEELSGLVYLHAALCEALRLYPPVPLVHKGVTNFDVLPSGKRVHPGMRILYSLYAMGSMEAIWGKDCLEFKPERWISDQGTLKLEHSHKFLVFNAGPRTCLGKDISFTQMKAVAAAVISNFHVQVLEGQIVCPEFSIILYMKNGLMVEIRERRD
ncbi:noroxomaritidine synthase 2-like [Magnolia sinica]|uniref:noroxomaritidine synthase 2-like n=1 Tax=Magnolia sinica TaxID=86752 RepID=UPI002659B3F5|nr:noroxomaritidine synthase 2-like [Magnolia sinica]